MKVNPTGNNEYYLDENLVSNLDIAKKAIKNDWDFVILIDGRERSGKSKIGQQVAQYVDSTFNINRIAFTSQQFKKMVLEAKPYTAIIYDEAYTGLSSKGAMGIINRSLVEMLAEVGQKNLFIFVIMPTFFDLVKYVALWRSAALIHVYTGENFYRGYFAFYNDERKKYLYIVGKKFYQYRQGETEAKPNFIGRFTNASIVDEAEYKRLKLVNLKNKESIRQEKELQAEIMDILFTRLQECTNTDLTHTIKMQILDLPYGTYWHRLKIYNQTKELNNEPINSNSEIPKDSL